MTDEPPVRVRTGARVAGDRRHPAQLRAVHRRRVRRPASTARRSRRSTPPPRRCSPRWWRPGRRTSTGPWPPPGPRTTGCGRRCAGASRGKYLFRIARLVQERARELAVLESIDNGKPIRESRDVDLPLVAAHFFYYAGWADKLGHAGCGADPRPLGVAGQVIPWNFPLLMLAWKIAPALACGNTVVLKPAETTPLTALAFADICRQADLPPGVVNIVTGAGETGPALVEHPGVDKVAFTGSTDVGRRDRPVGGRLPQEGHAGAGRQGGQRRVRRRPARRGRRGHRQRHLLQPGPRVLRRQPAAGAGVDRRRRAGPAAAAARHAPPGRPARQEHRHRRHQLAEQLDRIRELSAAGEQEGAERWSPPCELPERGYWFPPTVFTGVTQAHRIAREEVFGPVLSVLTFRTPDEAVAKANNTPYGLSAGVWTDKGSRILWMAQRLRAGVVWANTFNRFDPTSPFGGYTAVGLRPRGRAPRAWRPTSMPDAAGEADASPSSSPRRARPGRAQDLQALRRRGVPPVGVGPVLRGDLRQRRHVPGQRRPGLPQGRPRRRRRRPHGVPRLVGRHRLQPRPGAVPGGRGARGPPRPVRGWGRRGRGPSAQAGAAAWSTPPSTGGSGTPAGPTRSPRSRARPTRSPGPTSPSPCPSRRAWRRWSPRSTRRCWASCRWWRR